MKELTSDERRGRLSGYGWAVGYIAGFFWLLIVAPLIRGGLDEASLPAFRFSFVVTSLFFLLFSLPLFSGSGSGFRRRGRPSPILI